VGGVGGPRGPRTEVEMAVEGVDGPQVFLHILREDDECFHIL